MNLRHLAAIALSFACLGLGACTRTKADRTVAGQTKYTLGGGMISKVPLIPRDVLFGNPDRAAVRLSNDGRYISFLSPVEGVMNVWVAPADSPDKAEPVTFDKGRGIRSYFWAYNNTHLLYTQDKDGDENWRVYTVEVATKTVADLTPQTGVRAEIESVSADFPNEILIGLNDRNEQFHDIYRLNIINGQKELVLQNDEYAGFVTDDAYQVRFASKYADDGSFVYYAPDGSGGWKEFMKVASEDTFNTYFAGFDKSGKIAYFGDSRGRNTSALTTLDLETGEQKVLAEDPLADLSGTMSHPTEKTIEAVSFDYDRRRFTILDERIRPDIEALEKLADGELVLTSRTLDDTRWVAAFLRDTGPTEYYLWDRTEQKATYLFSNRKALEGLPLAPMKPVIIPARDGLALVSYLTIPVHVPLNADGMPTRAVPLVLNVHGGPWARDSWGYDAEHQLLANRGYAVLAVNFRGSTGLGKNFTNAGNGEWAAKMHDDLIDAVTWAIGRGIADPERIAIMGGSYGGYATLVGLTYTPEVFACGVDIVGPSNLITLLNSIPPYWAPALEMFKRRLGDHTTEEGRKFLESRSPLNFVDRISKPLLIAQGANDPRVKQAEADQIVKAMQDRNIPVTYVLYPNEGHGFARPENNKSFMAVTEAFLAQHLGGRYEPIGKDFEGSSITVPAGADGVPGLSAALQMMP